MGTYKDLTGQKFGMLTAIKRIASKNGRSIWLCRCDCGNIKEVNSRELLNGDTKSCGLHRVQDIIGQKFNRLTVIKRLQNDKYQNTRWLCQCDCGKYIETYGISLRNNKTKSCGCLTNELRRKKKKDNPFIKEPLYWRYTRIKSRCFSKSNRRYKDYGGRGISMCDEWKNDFMSFYNWAMANGYKDDLTIDRIDNDKGYYPENCRWVNNKEQANNRRNNIIVKYQDKEMTLKQWASLLNLNYKSVHYYYCKRKFSLEKILEIKKENNKSQKNI